VPAHFYCHWRFQRVHEDFDTDVALKNDAKAEHRLPLSCRQCSASVCYKCLLKYQRLQLEGFKKPKDLRIELKCAYCKYAKGFDMRRPLVHREYCKLLEHCNHVLQRTASDTSARTAAGPDDESLDSVSSESRGEPLIIIAAGAGEAASPNDVVDLTSDGDHHENNDNVPGAV